MLFYRFKTFLIFIALFFVGAVFYFYQSQPPKNLEVYFLDIGQGDSALIRTPAGQNILIDGGPDNSVIYRLGEFLPYFLRPLDLVILSHPHPDHLIGLVEALRRFKVKKVLATSAASNSAGYKIWQSIIKERGIEVLDAQKISQIPLAKNLEFKIIYPPAGLDFKKLENDNDASIVLKLSFGEIDFLFGGDATYSVEEKLIAQNQDLEAEILKVAHHGAKNATTKEFLEKVKPILAVISVGENQFGHPARRTLKNLENQGAVIKITKKQGTIKVFSDGKTWWLVSNNK